MDVKQAVRDLVASFRHHDESEEAHYHLTNGVDLTIIAGLHDLEMHLGGEIEDFNEELPGEVTIDRICNDSTGVQKIQVIAPSAPMTVTFRVTRCDDPTCEKALQDYWL
jgi:hypothetical protein